MTLELRTLQAGEVETLIDWAADEGWNPGLHDARAFFAADPLGFIGGFNEGEMVSGIAAVGYGSSFGFIGLYICKPEFRGNGYGRAVWDAGMARLEGRTIGLDGVPAQQGNYLSMGFEPEYRTMRYSGYLQNSAANVDTVIPFTEEMVPELVAFEADYFPAPRRSFLQVWLQAPHRVFVAKEEDEITGFGVIRACRDGYKVGPLFAASVDAADSLLNALAELCDDEVHLDVPLDQTDFIANLVRAGFTPGFETARMYRGPAPVIGQAGVFAVTSLELG